jgi:hypothetical protein
VAVKSYSSRTDLERDTALPESSGLPAPPAVAFTIPRPRSLSMPTGTSRWAPVLRTTAVRAAPRSQARVVERVGAKTPEGTANIVPVLARRADRAGRLWLRVRVPSLPENREGWVPRVALGGYTLVSTHLVVDLRRLQARLYSSGRQIFSAPIGVGTPSTPTPRGEFYVRSQLSSFRSPFYGPVALGTSARSQVLTEWPAGGFIGLHGTNRPDLLPGRVSHGCIRLRNADIVRLARLMPIGTPLTIR